MSVQVLERNTHSLEELAAKVRHEHDQVVSALSSAVEHAILAGEALLQAKQVVPRGTWQRWMVENFASPGAVYAGQHLWVYMRIALNKDLVRESHVTSVLAAQRLLSREVYAKGQALGHKVIELDPAILDAVRRGEMTQTAAAEHLGVCKQTIRNRLDGGRKNRANQARLHAARKALHKQERDRAVQGAGGSVAEAYSLIRRSLQQLERAMGDATSREARAALSTAIDRLHGAEDQIGKAVRLGQS